MKNKLKWDGLLIIPLLGFFFVYLFIAIAIYKYGSSEIYNVNSTDAVNQILYNIAYYFFSFGILILFSLGIISLIYLIIMKKLLFSKTFFIYLIILILIYILAIKVDVN